MPGAQGTGSATPGNSGDPDGERNGSGAGANDFSANDTATVTVGEINLTKSVLNPQARYAIGDLVEYQIVISLPANQVITSAVFQDVLDQGLTLSSETVVYDAGVTAGNNPTAFDRTDDAPMAGQETLELDFGTLTNSNNAVAEVTVTYFALVDNILGNQNNQTLANTATLSFDNPAGGGTETVSDNASVTVGEPTLTVLKNPHQSRHRPGSRRHGGLPGGHRQYRYHHRL